MNSLRKDLANCLDEIKGTSNFSSIQSSDFFLPGLVIDQDYQVAFPLIDSQAKDIIEMSQKAPFGKGTATIIDDKVRSGWKIEANRIRLSN